MAFPHPKSRKDNDRKEDEPKYRGVLLNFLGRTINVTEDRQAKDNVNPAENRTFGALVHNVAMCDFVVMISTAPLVAVGRQGRDDSGKVPEHLCPAELGSPKCLIASRLGEVEA